MGSASPASRPAAGLAGSAAAPAAARGRGVRACRAARDGEQAVDDERATRAVPCPGARCAADSPPAARSRAVGTPCALPASHVVPARHTHPLLPAATLCRYHQGQPPQEACDGRSPPPAPEGERSLAGVVWHECAPLATRHAPDNALPPSCSNALTSCPQKRKFETGRPSAMTKLTTGEKRIHLVRARGGTLKHRALRLNTGNFAWGGEGACGVRGAGGWQSQRTALLLDFFAGDSCPRRSQLTENRSNSLTKRGAAVQFS